MPTVTRRVDLNCSKAAAEPCMGRIRLASARAALLAVALASGPVDALGLGEIAQQSAFGEPLRLVIPVITGASDNAVSVDLLDECFKLVGSGVNQSSEVPQIVNGRLRLERSASGTYLVVSTSRPINDPAVSVTVQASCIGSIRREYTLLLDPPVIQVPVAESTTRTRADLSGGTAETGVALGSRPSAEEPVKQNSPAVKSGPTTAPRKPARRVTGPRVAKVNPLAPAPPAASPRLRVSRNMGELEQGRNASGGAAPASAEDVEVETVVLQRRVAELTEMVQRMQQDLRAAQVARDAAEATAKATPLAVLERWAGGDLLLFGALIVLVALLIASWSNRNRAPARTFWSAMPLDTDSFGPTLVPESTIVGVNRQASMTAPSPPPSNPATLVSTAAPVASHVGPPASGFRDDLGLAFEEDLVRNAERYAALSTIERECPSMVEKLMRKWRRPEVIAYLRDVLVCPLAGTKPLSREAVSEVILLQSIAMESTNPAHDSPWQVELDKSKLL